MARLAVTKCQGAGNDFVLVDRTAGAPFDYPATAKALCDRRYGVGADGMLVLSTPSQRDVDVRMRIFNADGSEAETCGNGIRCVARYWHERRPGAPRAVAVETLSGIVRATIAGTGAECAIRTSIGVPEDVFVYDEPQDVGGISAAVADVLIGNPHSVAFVDVAPDGLDLAAIAAQVEAGGPFENGVNVELARVRDGGIDMRVFERGVGETLACGTGAVAVGVAAVTMRRAASPVKVAMRGGDVIVEWSGPDEQAYLTGGAELVFDTVVELPDSLVAGTAETASAAPAV